MEAPLKGRSGLKYLSGAVCGNPKRRSTRRMNTQHPRHNLSNHFPMLPTPMLSEGKGVEGENTRYIFNSCSRDILWGCRLIDTLKTGQNCGNFALRNVLEAVVA